MLPPAFEYPLAYGTFDFLVVESKFLGQALDFELEVALQLSNFLKSEIYGLKVSVG